ncbi:alpha/beta hydrolase YcfP [Celerinatantimonas sp. YJH-8]|uniref:alpha/beta hydrolase YcfP n=1 Tax=Celerinatantimonas sp. YJH-8 TaxID=3228714 RepID=UPI0038C49AC9
MIIYLHGFDSTSPGNYQKVMQLQFIDPNVHAISYSTIHPKHDLSHLLNAVTEVISHCSPDEPIVIVGVGLGGYWSERIGFLCGIPSVLINPNLHPETNMGGKVERIEEFEHIKGKCVQNFRELNQHKSLVVLSRNDELLDTEALAQELQPFYEIIWDEVQTHKFADLGAYLSRIKTHRNRQCLPQLHAVQI